MGKKILVIGQGGREHALVWKLAQSAEVEKIYAAPGNPGIAELAQCEDIEVDDLSELLFFAWSQKIDLTVVGPEVPLTAGIVELFHDHDLQIFGPTSAAARLEGSKVFAKDLLRKYNIPTAAYETFEDMQPALKYALDFIKNGRRAVIKADGLAAGKGVVIASTEAQVTAALVGMMQDRQFGKAGDKVVIEEFLEGEEVSFFAISDGQNYLPLMAAQDHKQVYDNDEGPNTGGMGAYVNPPVYTAELHQEVLKTIVEPVIAAMQAEGCPYQGVLYAGLMITADGPKVLEFNCRFGDPETQAIMPMLDGDLLPVLEASARGDIKGVRLGIKPGSCVCLVLASGGYPESYQKGLPISGLDAVDRDTIVFHAGTAKKAGRIVTNGGRVLNLVSAADSIREAIDRVYREAAKISFENMHYRKDIGHKGLAKEG
jgi:phosphoribosylamine--glycine ligase